MMYSLAIFDSQKRINLLTSEYQVLYVKIGHFRTFYDLLPEHVVLEQYKDLFLNGLVNSFRMMYSLARFD